MAKRNEINSQKVFIQGKAKDHMKIALPGKKPAQFASTGESSLLSYLLRTKLMCSSSIIFDVGAHVGKWSMEALGLGQDFTLHLFEPLPQIYENLLKNPTVLQRWLGFYRPVG